MWKPASSRQIEIRANLSCQWPGPGKISSKWYGVAPRLSPHDRTCGLAAPPSNKALIPGPLHDIKYGATRPHFKFLPVWRATSKLCSAELSIASFVNVS
jgi:hypothetical protein